MLHLNSGGSTTNAFLYCPCDHVSVIDISGRNFFAVQPLIKDNYASGSPLVFLSGNGAPMLWINQRATDTFRCMVNNSASTVLDLPHGVVLGAGEERYGWIMVRETSTVDGGDDRLNGLEIAWYDAVQGTLQVFTKSGTPTPSAPSTSAADSVGWGNVLTSSSGFAQTNWGGYTGHLEVGPLSIRSYASGSDVPTFQEVVDRFWANGEIPSDGAHLDEDDVWSPNSDPTDFWCMIPMIPGQGGTLGTPYAGGGNGLLIDSTQTGYMRFCHYNGGSILAWDEEIDDGGGGRAVVIDGEHRVENQIRQLGLVIQEPVAIANGGRPLSNGGESNLSLLGKQGVELFVFYSDQSYVKKPDTYALDDLDFGQRMPGSLEFALIQGLAAEDALGGIALQPPVQDASVIYAERDGGNPGFTTDTGGLHMTLTNCLVRNTGASTPIADFTKFGVGARDEPALYGTGGNVVVGSGGNEEMIFSINVDNTPGLDLTDNIRMWAILLAGPWGKTVMTPFGSTSADHNDDAGYTPVGEVAGSGMATAIGGTSYTAAASGSTTGLTRVNAAALPVDFEAEVAAGAANIQGRGLERWVVWNETQDTVESIVDVIDNGGTVDFVHAVATRAAAASGDTITIGKREYRTISVDVNGDAARAFRNLRITGAGLGTAVVVATGWYNLTKGGTLVGAGYGGGMSYDDFENKSQPGCLLDMIDAVPYDLGGAIVGVASDGLAASYQTYIQAVKAGFPDASLMGYGQGVIGNGSGDPVSAKGLVSDYLPSQHAALSEACNAEGIPWHIPQGEWGRLGDKIAMAGQPDRVHHAAEAGRLHGRDMITFAQTLIASGSRYWRWHLTNPLA